jgi:hypothetical protein
VTSTPSDQERLVASRSADETRRAFDPRYPPEFQRGFGGVAPLRIAATTPFDVVPVAAQPSTVPVPAALDVASAPESPDAASAPGGAADSGAHRQDAARSRTLTTVLWLISGILVIGGTLIYLTAWPRMFGYNLDSYFYQSASDGQTPTVSVFDHPELLGYLSAQLLVQVAAPLIVLGVATAVANVAMISWRASARAAR